MPWAVLLAIPISLPLDLQTVRFLREILWVDTPLWATCLRSGFALYVLFSVETLFLCLLSYLFRKQSN